MQLADACSPRSVQASIVRLRPAINCCRYGAISSVLAGTKTENSGRDFQLVTRLGRGGDPESFLAPTHPYPAGGRMNGDPHEVGCGGSHLGRFGGALRKMGDDGNQLSPPRHDPDVGGCVRTPSSDAARGERRNTRAEDVTSLQ